MSGRDLKLDSLARPKARTKAKKRKKDTSPKRSGNFFRNFGRGRGRGRVTQSDKVVAVSNQEGVSEITPSNGKFIKVCVQVYDYKCSIVYRKKWFTGYHSFSLTGTRHY
jgi:hypothetical protein